MEIRGTEIIRLPREEVWKSITDADLVASCMPGVESMKTLEPNRKFEVLGGVKLGAAGVRAKTRLEWIRLREPDEASMSIRGSGPGVTIDGSTDLRLREVAEGTALDWTANVTVRGTVAMLAGRLMKPVMEKMNREFFARLRGKIEPDGAGSEG